ncbi:MAG: acyl-CoA synthetase [Alphaproteobacteria bacterium]
MEWIFGDMLDAVAAQAPADAPALIHGDRVVLWPDFDRRTNAIARAVHAHGIEPGAKVGFYMRNRPEYPEMLAAAFKARLVHVNVNYRYQPEELRYIFDNSDSEIGIFASEFAAQVKALQPMLPSIRLWIEVTEDGREPRCDFAVSYESLTEGDGAPLGIERSPDDLLLLYTGGTTGMPKGVMWPMSTLRKAHMEGTVLLAEPPTNLEEHLAAARENAGVLRQMPACPMMHGTGLFTAMGSMLGGGAVVTLPTQDHFRPEELWEAVDRHKVTNIAIVGDAFARPMLQVLDDNPGAYDLSSLAVIISSGVMWSREIKQGLLKHAPQAAMADSFGASEAIGFGTSLMTVEGEVQTAKFTIGDKCKVFSEDGREIEPGSGEAGLIARGGHLPLGYYKDAEKTASTFRTINGARYSIPGDFCTVEADGTLTLLGRGSVCINTGGEKVYPEEVEEVLKQHDAVADALVVGVPDEKWGQAVTAVVEPSPGTNAGEAQLRDHVRGHLAGYKVPKRVLFRDSLMRAPNGKADYKATTAYVLSTLGIDV